ncbi:MAG: hypothetical protein JW841_09175 [Deltaproteobacteria bacterium]|nr:hypothetical protein [Deltaproteobacteria bacterium]
MSDTNTKYPLTASGYSTDATRVTSRTPTTESNVNEANAINEALPFMGMVDNSQWSLQPAFAPQNEASSDYFKVTPAQNYCNANYNIINTAKNNSLKSPKGISLQQFMASSFAQYQQTPLNNLASKPASFCSIADTEASVPFGLTTNPLTEWAIASTQQTVVIQATEFFSAYCDQVELVLNALLIDGYNSFNFLNGSDHSPRAFDAAGAFLRLTISLWTVLRDLRSGTIYDPAQLGQTSWLKITPNDIYNEAINRLHNEAINYHVVAPEMFRDLIWQVNPIILSDPKEGQFKLDSERGSAR